MYHYIQYNAVWQAHMVFNVEQVLKGRAQAFMLCVPLTFLILSSVCLIPQHELPACPLTPPSLYLGPHG